MRDCRFNPVWCGQGDTRPNSIKVPMQLLLQMDEDFKFKLGRERPHG